jgi:hypothetical protein
LKKTLKTKALPYLWIALSSAFAKASARLPRNDLEKRYCGKGSGKDVGKGSGDELPLFSIFFSMGCCE